MPARRQQQQIRKGDIVGQPMLAHKAVHEGHVAAEVAAGQKSFFDARVIPSVAYTDPEVAWVGVTEEQCKREGIKYGKGSFPWAASGRSLSLGRDEGMTKLLFDDKTHRIIGGGIVGTNAATMLSTAAVPDAVINTAVHCELSSEYVDSRRSRASSCRSKNSLSR